MEASSSSNTGNNPVQSCSMCPDKFLSNDKLTLHYVINHKYHICEVCTTVTSTLDDLKSHESETHLPIKCEICCYQITELSELSIHRYTTHQLLTCHFCPLTLNTMFELNFHLKRKHFVLVEPLNLENGLFRDFSMGKWGYLCLLCGKNRETAGFIGHYRGFHRIRIPTLARILLKQNITLSIIGTTADTKDFDVADEDPNRSLEDNSLPGLANRSPEDNSLSTGMTNRSLEDNSLTGLTNRSLEDNSLPTGITGQVKLEPVEDEAKAYTMQFNQRHSVISGLENVGNRLPNDESKLAVVGNSFPNVESKFVANSMPDVENSLANVQNSAHDSFVDFIETLATATGNGGGANQSYPDGDGGDGGGDNSLLYSMLLQRNATGADPSLMSMTHLGDPLSDGGVQASYPRIGDSGGKEDTSELEDTSEEEDLDSSGSRRGDGSRGSNHTPTSKRKKQDEEPTVEPSPYEDFDDVESEVDPNEVECVLTETSEVESEEEGDEEGGEEEMRDLMTKLYNMAIQGAPSQQINKIEDLDSSTECVEGVPRKLGKYLVLNNLVITNKIGLNQMEHAPSGFRCELCHGYFDSREGLKELLRHMRTLHGIKCNKDTRHLSSVFDNFGRVKMTSYPEYCGPIHVCPFCSLRASSKRFLRRHVFTFHGDTWLQDAPAGPLSYPCGQCKRAFWHMTERDQHELKEHEDSVSTLRCHICVRPFLRKVLVNQHIRHCHPEETDTHRCVSYKCRSCDVLLFNYSSLENHAKAEHGTNFVYRCSHCDLGLKNMKSLRYHIKMQHGKASQTFECELCGRVTYSLRSLNSHRRLKHDARHRAGFKCRLCDANFDSKDERQLHYARGHANESPFICPDCNKGFASKSGLYGHRQVHKVKDQVQENFFKCQFCGKEFTRRDSYNEHLLIHMGPRHKCPHCNKDFVQRSNLVRHIRIHTGEKPYKCTHCDKTFSDKGACNSHIRVHTGEETCACPFCGQTFSKKQKLKYHVRKHTGEGLLECDICNKSFTNSYALKDHKATHARQAINFNCKECGSVFTENRFLNRHRAVVHSDIPCFACPFCEKIFSHQRALRTHILIHAGVNYLQCVKCSSQFVSRASLHGHLASEHSISVHHEFYHASYVCLEPDQVGLVMPKFSDEEVLKMSNQERDEVLRDYFNQIIEGKIELPTQFEFKLIQRNRARVDPSKKGLIAKLKQEQGKNRPAPKPRLPRSRPAKSRPLEKKKKKNNSKGGKKKKKADEWGPSTKIKKREEGHGYNFRPNFPRTIMSEDFDYEDQDDERDEYDAPSQYETSVINLSMRNRGSEEEDVEEEEEDDYDEEDGGDLPVTFVEAEMGESEEEGDGGVEIKEEDEDEEE